MSPKDLDRRTFLRRAGVAGAAIGVAGAGSTLSVSTTAGASGVEAPWKARRGPYLSKQIPDVVVIGAGVFGIFNAFNLRRMGMNVTVVDLYGPGNSRATSGGETRGVRTSYGDRPHGGQWMAWAHEANQRWRRLNEEWYDRLTAPLFFPTGDLILRRETSAYLEETQRLWKEQGIEHEVLDGDEVKYRWPVIRSEEVTIALYEPNAGVVRARRAIETVAKVFELEGGKVVIGRAEPGTREGGRLVDLEVTPGDRMSAGTYVFAVGPWFPKVFPELMENRIRISSMGHTVYFGTPPGDNRFSFPNLPSYGVPGCTGWPALPPDNRGFRVRTGGRQSPDPDLSPRRLDAEHIERPRSILAQWFPDMQDAPVTETRACHYESSSTRNFIIDRHPDYQNVWVTGGGSAEAFKQGPVLGEYIARRVVGLETDPAYDEAFRLGPGRAAGRRGEFDPDPE